MADFTTPNLQGANEKLNKALTDATALKDKLLAEHGGEASSILATLQSAVADLISSLGSLIPELPEIPNINMQSDFTQLANFDISTPDGLSQFTAQKASLEAQFGDALDAKGIDLDSVASQMNSLSLEDATAQIGDLVPNLQLPAGETIPIELPANIAQASEEAAKELVTQVNKETVSLATTEVEIIPGESAETTWTNVTETVETSVTKTGAKKITKTGTNEIIKVSDSGGEETIVSSGPTEEDKKSIDARKKRRRDLALAARTIIPGEALIAGKIRFLQRYTDTKVYEYEDKVNGFSSGSGTKYRTKYLSKSKTLRYFQSDTYDNEIKNGKSEKEAFILAREVGDWNWKEDSAGRIWYDRRFKKDRLT